MQRKRTRGRPRDAAVDQRILAGTLAVIAERGITGASMDEIAARSGVSKPTIYGRWPSKDELCVQAVGSAPVVLQADRGGDPRSECIAALDEAIGLQEGESARRLLPRILAEINDHPALARVFAEHIMQPRRAQCARIVQRAIDRGQLQHSTDLELAVDLLLGPIFYRRLISGAASLTTLPEKIVNAVWKSFGAST